MNALRRQEILTAPLHPSASSAVNTCLFLLISAILLLSFQTPAHAVRAVPWQPGKTIIVRAKVGATTEVVFPSTVENLTNPDPQLFSIRPLDNRLFIKPGAYFSSARLFVSDVEGRSFLIEMHEIEEPGKEDDSVEISPETAEPRAGPFLPPAPTPHLFELFAAMKQGRPLAGYEIQKADDLILDDLKVVRARIIKMYQGISYVGLVIEIENVWNEALRVDPQQFRLAGIMAASVTDLLLSSKAPADSIEAFKGYPKQTTAYAVVDKVKFMEKRALKSKERSEKSKE